MRMALLQTGLVWGVLAGVASAQGTITYFWDINDTGSDTYLYSGEEVINFKMYGLMDPEQVGFAWDIYEIIGGDEFGSAGLITGYQNKLGSFTDDGELQGNNNILDIEAFQLAPFWGDDFVAHNPILLYEIDWEITDSFTIATLTTANHQVNDVYTDDFGTTESYDAITTTATVFIPAPASVLPLVGMLAWRRRR